MPRDQISVLIVTKDRDQLLWECLKSIRDEVRGDLLEVVVVDDASSQIDRTWDVIKKARRDMEIPIKLLILKRNVGPAVARNIAAKAASGELFWFIDDDVRVCAGSSKALRAENALHPHAILGGGVNIECLSRSPRTCSKCSIDYPLEVGESRYCFAGEIWGCNMLIPALVFRGLGGFSERIRIYGDEFELLLRHQERGGSLRQVQGAHINHLRSAAELKRISLLLRAFRRGRNQTLNAKLFKWPCPTQIENAKGMVSGLKHTFTAGCFRGMMEATKSLGRLLG